MPTCPAGHDSATTDYCDTCGTRMLAVAPPPAPPLQQCANCGATRDGRFCEECGHDSTVPVGTPRPVPLDPPATVTWTALVRADRAWFDEVRRRDGLDAASLEFPRYCPERRFVLTGPQMAIGRRSRSRGTDPEIDLSGPPLDPGVSAQHALLLARPDGNWELVDVGSTNGTSLGDAPAPIAPHTPEVLADGDCIKLGAWTTITVMSSTPG